MGSGKNASKNGFVAYRLKFSGRALREIGEAFELQLKRLEQVPLLYTEIIPGVRRTLLPRFPYGVFYSVKNDLVHVLAVIHHEWSSRRWPGERSR